MKTCNKKISKYSELGLISKNKNRWSNNWKKETKSKSKFSKKDCNRRQIKWWMSWRGRILWRRRIWASSKRVKGLRVVLTSTHKIWPNNSTSKKNSHHHPLPPPQTMNQKEETQVQSKAKALMYLLMPIHLTVISHWLLKKRKK